jgi:hypothetical protein
VAADRGWTAELQADGLGRAEVVAADRELRQWNGDRVGETGENGDRGQNGNRRATEPGRAGGGGHGNPKTRSDTMLGIDKLYSTGSKGHIYIHVHVCKYAGNPLIGGETTIYKYTSNRFDLTIAQSQIKDGEIVDPKKRYYLTLTRIKLDIPLKRAKLDRAFVFQLSKLLFKLNQLVQGIQYGFLEKRVIQRTSLLMNLTTWSCENMAILLERHPEYHEPPVCH